MSRRRHGAIAAAVLIAGAAASAAYARQEAEPPAPRMAFQRSTDPMGAPAGRYVLDRPRSALLGRVNHLGLSQTVFRFYEFGGEYQWDPARPEASRLSVTVQTDSIDMGLDQRFNEEIGNANYLDAEEHPTATFTSERVIRTGPDTADVPGVFTLLGKGRPATLRVRFNGRQPGLNNRTYTGFSGTMTFLRSDYGMEANLATVGDEVTLEIQAEFFHDPAEQTPSRQNPSASRSG